MAGSRDAGDGRHLCADEQRQVFARRLASSLGSDFELQGAVAIALARIGGAVARDALLGSLRSGRKSLDVPWAALALGILEDDRRRAGDAPAPRVRDALQARLAGMKNPSTLAAIGLGLALAGDRSAVEALELLLQAKQPRRRPRRHARHRARELDPERSEPTALDLLARSIRRPERKAAIATALGQIGSPRAVDALVAQLGSRDANLHALAAEVRALGATRSPRAVEPLLGILADPARPDLIRAHASMALGLLADPRPASWNVGLLARVPWRAFPAEAFAWPAGILTWL